MDLCSGWGSHFAVAGISLCSGRHLTLLLLMHITKARGLDFEKRAMDSESRVISAERRLRDLDMQLQEAVARSREAERQRQEQEVLTRNAEAAAKQVDQARICLIF